MLYMFYMVKNERRKPMSTYRIRLQEALLKKWKIENGKCKMEASSRKATPQFSILHSTFSILELVAYASFASAWLVAIVTHL